MSFEQKLEKRLAHLEGLLLDRLTRIELAYEGRLAHLEAEIHRLARHERRTDREVEEVERREHRVEHRVHEIERRLKPHHYPATRGISIKPA